MNLSEGISTKLIITTDYPLGLNAQLTGITGLILSWPVQWESIDRRYIVTRSTVQYFRSDTPGLDWRQFYWNLLLLAVKTKALQHDPRINISIWHMTCDMCNVTCDMWHAKCDMWHNHKYSLLSIDMKTKVVQHVPRINITIWHKTCDIF